MKHNLPQPSQAWGSSIDRRVAYLENDVTLMKSKVNNSYETITALNSSRAVNGIARPFYHTYHINKPGAHDGIGEYEDLLSLPLEWEGAGSFMQLTITGYLYTPLRELSLSNYNQPEAVVGVRDGDRHERKLVIAANTITERQNNVSQYALSCSLSFTTVVDFNSFEQGSAFIGLRGLYGQPSYINNHNNRAYLSVQISGVRY